MKQFLFDVFLYVRQHEWGREKLKRNLLAFIAFFSVVVCGVTTANAQTKSNSTASVIKVSVNGANIKFKKGGTDTIEMKYYGAASDSDYDLSAVKKGNQYKITLNRTGSGMAPSIKEGGVIVKIPDDSFSLLRIRGKSGSGIVLNDINVDTDIVTEDCAVVINNKNSSNKISIDSKGDAYEIRSVPMAEAFYLNAAGSVVEYTFTEQPFNLKLKLTGGYAELPDGWSRNFTIGLGQPKMEVKLDGGIFELSVKK